MDFLYKVCLKKLSFYDELRVILTLMHIDLRVKYIYVCEILMKLELSQQIYEKFSNTKFRENPRIGNRVVPCGRKTDGQTERTLIRI